MENAYAPAAARKASVIHRYVNCIVELWDMFVGLFAQCFAWIMQLLVHVVPHLQTLASKASIKKHTNYQKID
jgi:hypothetical protein